MRTYDVMILSIPSVPILCPRIPLLASQGRPASMVCNQILEITTCLTVGQSSHTACQNKTKQTEQLNRWDGGTISGGSRLLRTQSHIKSVGFPRKLSSLSRFALLSYADLILIPVDGGGACHPQTDWHQAKLAREPKAILLGDLNVSSVAKPAAERSVYV